MLESKLAKMKLLAFFIIASSAQLFLSAEAGNIISCYFGSWTVYRPGNGKFDVSDIDPSLCTHVNFGFVGIGTDGSIDILDSTESDDDGQIKGFQHIVALKEKNPEVKVLISMGGWNEGSHNFSIVAADPSIRQNLVNNVIAFIEEHGFDGFDLDWEYPSLRDTEHTEEDYANFVLLLQELKAALNPKGYLLTAAVSGGVTNMDIAYPDVVAVSDALDLISVMVYDFHGAFEDHVGHTAPLYASSKDVTDEDKTLNVAAGIQHWLDKGADPNKMLLGVGTYGRSFTLADPSNTELYAPIISGGAAGPYTRQEGILGYNEICELHSDWEYIWDDEQKVPHKVSGNQWVGYDNVQSLELKVEFGKSKGLGGIMVWAYDTDDFKGICGGGTYPLLKAIKKTLNN